MKNKNQNQQGDVLLRKLNNKPSGLKKIGKKGITTLAEGEHTGHHHSIFDSDVALLESPDGMRYVENKNDFEVELKHQEHNPIKVPSGIHQIGIVREHDYFLEMVRPVVD